MSHHSASRGSSSAVQNLARGLGEFHAAARRLTVDVLNQEVASAEVFDRRPIEDVQMLRIRIADRLVDPGVRHGADEAARRRSRRRHAATNPSGSRDVRNRLEADDDVEGGVGKAIEPRGIAGLERQPRAAAPVVIASVRRSPAGRRRGRAPSRRACRRRESPSRGRGRRRRRARDRRAARAGARACSARRARRRGGRPCAACPRADRKRARGRRSRGLSPDGCRTARPAGPRDRGDGRARRTARPLGRVGAYGRHAAAVPAATRRACASR